MPANQLHRAFDKDGENLVDRISTYFLNQWYNRLRLKCLLILTEKNACLGLVGRETQESQGTC